jgi:hypothetical protein
MNTHELAERRRTTKEKMERPTPITAEQVWNGYVFTVMLVVSTKCVAALPGGSSEMLLARFYVWLWRAAGL